MEVNAYYTTPYRAKILCRSVVYDGVGYIKMTGMDTPCCQSSSSISVQLKAQGFLGNVILNPAQHIVKGKNTQKNPPPSARPKFYLVENV